MGPSLRQLADPELRAFPMTQRAAKHRLPRIGLFPRLALFALLAILVTVFVSSIITYRFAKTSLERALASELLAIASGLSVSWSRTPATAPVPFTRKVFSS